MNAKVPDDHVLTSIEALEALYGTPKAAALVKEIGHVSDHYRAFIEAAPFVVLATTGPEGLDCSPRGDPPGFVRVQDERTVLIPDRRGNNRADALHNLEVALAAVVLSLQVVAERLTHIVHRGKPRQHLLHGL